MLDNAEWLDGLNYLGFLRDIGRHFSVNRMLSFESVKSRLDRDQSLSFLEFNYMILQAYDFLELHRRHGCLLQIGGSDQWGNIVNGIDLTRRVAGAEIFGLTSPSSPPPTAARWASRPPARSGSTPRRSRPTTSGSSGATPPTPTSAASSSSTPSSRSRNATASARWPAPRSTPPRSSSPTRSPPLPRPEAARAAEATARAVFEEGGAGEALEVLAVRRTRWQAASAVTHFLVMTGIVQSGKEAKRLIAERGLRFNNELVLDPNALVTARDHRPRAQGLGRQEAAQPRQAGGLTPDACHRSERKRRGDWPVQRRKLFENALWSA